MVKWRIQHETEYVLCFQIIGRLERLESVCQENQKILLWWKDIRNSVKEQMTMGPYKLDQEAQVVSNRSTSI